MLEASTTNTCVAPSPKISHCDFKRISEVVWAGIISLPILQIRQLRFRELYLICHGHDMSDMSPLRIQSLFP